eukprot:gb/GECG01013074.1/.p1 GENE.gb/GECG01013074.1/~~gb/GECG01013074.1/.p1  ORF type:complete len:152 (+),score=3.44 gb/GECG01013074.1/:1-456(+)
MLVLSARNSIAGPYELATPLEHSGTKYVASVNFSLPSTLWKTSGYVHSANRSRVLLCKQDVDRTGTRPGSQGAKYWLLIELEARGNTIGNLGARHLVNSVQVKYSIDINNLLTIGSIWKYANAIQCYNAALSKKPVTCLTGATSSRCGAST